MVIKATEAREKANDYQRFLLGVHLIHGAAINMELNKIFEKVEEPASVGEYEIVYELSFNDDDIAASLINVLKDGFGYSVENSKLPFIKISWRKGVY